MTCEATPAQVLTALAKDNDLDVNGKAFAVWMDNNDELAHLRNEFNVPENSSNDVDCLIYFCGNSLGLQPKKAAENVTKVLDNWRMETINSHFKGFLPAALCDEVVQEDMATIVGAKTNEVAIMNALSVNLHLLLISFYQPTPRRHKILIEAKAFPSDHYIAESQIRLHGYDPDQSLLLIKTKEGEDTVCMDDVCDVIEREGDSIAVVMLPGVHYFTGQVFDMKRITEVAHRKGCMVGFDLAHAVGNIKLLLHEWQVDFACWCTYKYLNSGAGCIGGAFMHEKHERNSFPKLLGWWGHRMQTRFDMTNDLELQPGIGGYRISNPPPLLMAPLKSSLDIFKQTTMDKLRKKSFLLTGYLEYLLLENFQTPSNRMLEIITPQMERGCQLSLRFNFPVEKIFEELEKRGVRCDVRKPSVIRIAPTPLYNTFQDVFNFIQILSPLLDNFNNSS